LILFLFAEEASSDLGNILPQVQYNNCGYKIPGVAEPSFPFLAAIGYNNSRGNVFFGCGGVLINRKYVLVINFIIKEIKSG